MSSTNKTIFLYRGTSERSFSKNHKPVSGLFFGVKSKYVTGWGNVKRYTLRKDAKIYNGESSDEYCGSNNLYDKEFPQFKEYFGMYGDFTKLNSFVDLSMDERDIINKNVEKHAGKQFCWMDYWTWCLQLAAKIDLESKGYDGAHWTNEDFGNQEQYQIWNLNVVKSNDGVVESIDNMENKIIDKLKSLGYNIKYINEGWYDEKGNVVDWEDDREEPDDDWYYVEEPYYLCRNDSTQTSFSWRIDEQSNKFTIVGIYGNYKNSEKGFATKTLDELLRIIPNDWTINIENNINSDYWNHIRNKYKEHNFVNTYESLNDIDEKLVYHYGRDQEEDKFELNRDTFTWFSEDEEYAKGYGYLRHVINLNKNNLLNIGEINDYIWDDDDCGYTKEFKKLCKKVGMTPEELADYYTENYGWHGFEMESCIWEVTCEKPFADIVKHLGYNGVIATENGVKTYGILDFKDMFVESDNGNEPFEELSMNDIVSKVENDLGTTDYTIEGPSYILPDGKFLKIADSNVDIKGMSGGTAKSGKSMHLDVDGYILNKYYNNNNIKDFHSYYLNDICIRVNNGFEKYVVLPNDEPSKKQYESLLLWLDKYFKSHDELEVILLNGGWDNRITYTTYDCQSEDELDFISDHIVKRIEQYYSSGKLREDLSKEQEEFFKNSKIRDKDGNLLVCYHGTPNPGFKEFNPKDNNSQFGDYKFNNANVNYFTTDRKAAASYTEFGYEDNGNVYACYINIVNPFIVDNESLSDIKSSFNIKDKRLRDKQIQLFDSIFNKWKNKWTFYNTPEFKQLNNDLHKINLSLVPTEYDKGKDDEDIEVFDLITLGNNSMYGGNRAIEYSYEIDELFSDDMYDQLRDDIIGEEDDYYLSTDDVVRYVLAMNEDDNTNYDGIIIDDIVDSKEMFSQSATDVITLKSSNQIKLISNMTPTNSTRIDEDGEYEDEANSLINQFHIACKTNTLENKENAKNGTFYALNDILNEDGNYARLYHETSVVNAIKIIKSDTLKAGGNYAANFRDTLSHLTDEEKHMPADVLIKKLQDEHRIKGYVCLTRDFEFAKGRPGNFKVIFVINKDKLTNHYKVTPVSDDKNDENGIKIARYTGDIGSKAEEVVDKDITNLHEYVDEVIIVDDKNNKATNYIKSNIGEDEFEKWNIVVSNDGKLVSYKINNGLDESLLLEKTRAELINKSKTADAYKDTSKGKNRYERRLKSRIATSVAQYNKIDMDAFFKRDILTVGIDVHGETNNYVVTMRFQGVLREIQNEVKANNGKLEFKLIARAMSRIYNSDNIHVHCTCPDFKYRQAYWSDKDGYGTQYEPRPSNITNPNDSKGGGCKHVLLVMSNLDWVMKVASVINNYIKYCQQNLQNNYATYMFPKIYGMPYKQAVQLSLFDNGLLPNDQQLLTQIASTNLKDKDARGRWVAGNSRRFTPTKPKNEPQEAPEGSEPLFWFEKDKKGNERTVSRKDNDRDTLGRFMRGNTASKRKQSASTPALGNGTNKQVVPSGNEEDDDNA